MLLFVDYIATKKIIASALNTLVGGLPKVIEASYAQFHAAHALLHLFLGCHLEETAKLFIQLLFDAFLSEQRSQSV